MYLIHLEMNHRVRKRNRSIPIVWLGLKKCLGFVMELYEPHYRYTAVAFSHPMVQLLPVIMWICSGIEKLL